MVYLHKQFVALLRLQVRQLIVYRMEFDKTRCSCSWNSDQNYSHTTLPGVVGWVGLGGLGVGVEVGGVYFNKGTHASDN